MATHWKPQPGHDDRWHWDPPIVVDGGAPRHLLLKLGDRYVEVSGVWAHRYDQVSGDPAEDGIQSNGPVLSCCDPNLADVSDADVWDYMAQREPDNTYWG